MILGLGVDLCSISRMDRAIRSPHFVRRIFRPSEIAYADAKENARSRAASFAAAFAAREAFAKASGISMYTLALSSKICLERAEEGPRLIVPPETDPAFSEAFSGNERKQIWVSISHDGDYTVAVVLISREESPEQGESRTDLAAEAAFDGVLWNEVMRVPLPPRPPGMNKEDRGRVLVAGGSVEFPGAPVLTCLAALRSGGGVVSLLSLPDVCRSCASRLPEAVQLPVPAESDRLSRALAQLRRTGAAVAGPGLGRSDAAVAFVSALWEKWTRPLLMDADALYALAVSGKRLRPRGDVVLTPHEGEAARLLGTTPAEVRRNREEAASLLAKRWGCVLLKGHGTLIAACDPENAESGDGTVRLARLGVGGPELSVPGSGDVLSGCIGTFLAQGLPPFDAAFLGGALHGLAGRRLGERLGVDGILASEIADELPFVLRMLRRRRE